MSAQPQQPLPTAGSPAHPQPQPSPVVVRTQPAASPSASPNPAANSNTARVASPTVASSPTASAVAVPAQAAASKAATTHAPTAASAAPATSSSPAAVPTSSKAATAPAVSDSSLSVVPVSTPAAVPADTPASVVVTTLTPFQHLLNAVLQPQLGQTISSTDAEFAKLLCPSLATILQDDSTLLTNASNDDLLKMNLIAGGGLPNNMNADTINSIKNNIRMQTQVENDVNDPKNPKWSGSAEGIADLVTTLGPAITLGVIVFWGVDLNSQKVVTLARGTLAMWVAMTFFYLLAKASNIWLPSTFNCTGYNEAKIRNLVLWVSSLCATSFLILHGMLVTVGFKTQNTIGSDTVSSSISSNSVGSTGNGF